jgi:hypothetical protein
MSFWLTDAVIVPSINLVTAQIPIASPLLTLVSTFPRFPRLGLVQRLPSHVGGYRRLSTHGQASDNRRTTLNNSG